MSFTSVFVSPPIRQRPSLLRPGKQFDELCSTASIRRMRRRSVKRLFCEDAQCPLTTSKVLFPSLSSASEQANACAFRSVCSGRRSARRENWEHLTRVATHTVRYGCCVKFCASSSVHETVRSVAVRVLVISCVASLHAFLIVLIMAVTWPSVMPCPVFPSSQRQITAGRCSVTMESIVSRSVCKFSAVVFKELWCDLFQSMLQKVITMCSVAASCRLVADSVALTVLNDWLCMLGVFHALLRAGCIGKDRCSVANLLCEARCLHRGLRLSPGT
jgi:hypothetical protein